MDFLRSLFIISSQSIVATTNKIYEAIRMNLDYFDSFDSFDARSVSSIRTLYQNLAYASAFLT